MIRTIRSEWVKLSTVFAHKMLVIVAFGFPIVVGALLATFGDVAGGPDSIEMAEFVTGMMIVSTMLLGVVAAIGLTSEYTHNTLRPTYAATPRRARVLAAKLLVSSSVTLVVASLVAFGCWFVTSSIFTSRGGEVSIGDDPVLTVLVSGIVLSVIVTWFAFGLGLIIRNSPAAVSILLLWPLLIEGLLILVVDLIGWDDLDKYAPYQAAIVAGTPNPDADALGRPGGHIWFAVVAVVLVAVGVLLDERRDA